MNDLDSRQSLLSSDNDAAAFLVEQKFHGEGFMKNYSTPTIRLYSPIHFFLYCLAGSLALTAVFIVLILQYGPVNCASSGLGTSATRYDSGRDLLANQRLLETAANAGYEKIYFNSTFGSSGIWGPAPSEVTDELWTATSRNIQLAITDDEVRAVGKKPGDFARVPERFRAEHGDMVLAGLEVTHQLHCLNLIRKMTYFDHYRHEQMFADVSPTVLRAHVDHCIDNLRQKILCDCDTTYMMSYWVQGRRLAMPDFAVQHQCRPCQAIIQDATKRNVDTALTDPTPGEKIWTRPDHP